MSQIIHVVIADDNIEFCNALSQSINTQPDLRCVRCVHDGQSAIDAVMETKADVLILDHVMPQLDGLAVLEKLRELSHQPKTLMLTAFGQESLVTRAAELGAGYYLMKPFDMPVLFRRIRQLMDPEHVPDHVGYDDPRRPAIEREVAHHLSTLGVPPHFKGYAYLKEAITLVVLEPALLGAVTKQLYPLVADLSNTAPHQVERSIRHAIESTWVRGNLAHIDELFAYTVDAERGKPTNSSFIARLADLIRMELMAS